jgi:sterol desaturase/sphingolipid hydroxylase (fatty acid hydroxylase superfamily)
MENPMSTLCLAFALGVVTWTLLEYLLHRFVFHEKRLGPWMARDHLRHHAKVDWFVPLSTKLALAAVILSLLTLGASFVGALPAALYLVGTVSGWVFYEVLHRRIHVAPPRGAYGTWARRHHLAHHFGHATKNHGVSSPFWDLVFGTYLPVAQVTVPRLHAHKFPWLFEGETIAARWQSHYRVV